jgi:hypothetical protein
MPEVREVLWGYPSSWTYHLSTGRGGSKNFGLYKTPSDGILFSYFRNEKFQIQNEKAEWVVRLLGKQSLQDLREQAVDLFPLPIHCEEV